MVILYEKSLINFKKLIAINKCISLVLFLIFLAVFSECRIMTLRDCFMGGTERQLRYLSRVLIRFVSER